MGTETPRTLQYFYLTIKDRLGLLHSDDMNYQEATFIKDAHTVGLHIHSLLVAAGERRWDNMSAVHSIAGGAESSDVFPNDENEVAKIRRVWALGDDDELLQEIKHRNITRTDIAAGTYPSWEIMEGKFYWFPTPQSSFNIKIEYVAAYDSTPVSAGATPVSGGQVDEMGDKPDLPPYADDYFLNELTVRAAIAHDKNPSPWMNLAMRSRESMIMNAARDVPRRDRVLYGGY